jgi:2-dehydropantoate 2-reductase
MKICIVGAGAIGGLLGFQLARSGHEVSVVARGPHLEAIRKHGLKLVNQRDPSGSGTVRVAVEEDPARLAAQVGIQDVVFLGLKAHAIAPMLPRIAPLVGPQTVVIPAINGVPWWYFYRELGRFDGAVVKSVDPDGTMFGALDPSHLIGCVVHAAGEVRVAGEIHYTGGKRFILGEIDRTISDPLTPRLARIAEAMQKSGFDAVSSRDIRFDVWAKLIGNLSFNPVAALSSALMNQICADEGLLSVIRPMLVEGMRVAKALGVEIKMTPDERIDVARHLGNAKISMHQDFEAGRTPEIDAIVGAVLELAHWFELEAPTTHMVGALVRARARNLGLI